MKRLMFSLLIILALAGALPARALQPVSIILDQPEAPVKISEYTCYYFNDGRYDKGIRHRPVYSNATDRLIVAIAIRFVDFSVWNEYLYSLGGTSIEDLKPRSQEKGTWEANPYGAFTFLTGITFIYRVRFENGEIWQADIAAIAEQIGDIFEDFKPEELEEKPPE